MEKRSVSISQQLSSERARLIARNSLKLKSVAATVIFCGRALRGHRDDGPVIVEATSSYSRSNFHALLQCRVDAGDGSTEGPFKGSFQQCHVYQ